MIHLLQDWQMLYANAVSEAENGQHGTALEQAETAIKRRFEEESDTVSALEEARLYSALRTLQRLKAVVTCRDEQRLGIGEHAGLSIVRMSRALPHGIARGF